ncbi:MAG: MipA/OmpV family protein [Pseudomonadota bacterium]
MNSALRFIGITLIAGALSGYCSSALADSEQKPLWELGIGVGTLGFNDYRGSKSSSFYPVPVPYFNYRGPFLRSDRDGVRALFFGTDFLELNVSLNVTTPVKSNAAGIRSGMPSLKSILEVGPSLDFHLWKSEDQRVKFDLRMPVRGAFTLDFPSRYVGWSFTPRLNVDIRDVGGHAGWDLGLMAGPVFQDQRYNQYFYDVAPEFATTGRPEFKAAGGYSGTQLLASVSRRFPGYWVGAFVRHDLLGGAVFNASPLVQTHNYWMAGVGIAWIVGRSTTMVVAPDERL